VGVSPVKYNFDPRTKLIIVLCLSTLGLLLTNIYQLTGLLVVGIGISKFFGGNLFELLVKIKKMVFILIFIIILQSIFTKSGHGIITIGTFNVITDVGLNRGLGYLLRVLIIITSGIIITTSNARHMIQGIVQLGIPYEFAFMTAVGIKFMPLLVEEFKDTYIAIQLKGIELKSLSLIKRFKISTYVLTPVIANTINKSKQLSISVENRAFRTYDQRSSIIALKYTRIDYVVIITTLIATFLTIYITY
jgi:energy-coupling factor transport system permease protein